ncbi:hypothetical protein [Streptomyces sp. A5-4]|uniref:hypothetical protein n=1 Tax=Streptomyces sp. A5-4 TaxID=3384771 RepID=UPI003DA9831F
MNETLSGGSGWVLAIGIALLVMMSVLLTLPQSSLSPTDSDAPDADVSGDGQETLR